MTHEHHRKLSLRWRLWWAYPPSAPFRGYAYSDRVERIAARFIRRSRRAWSAAEFDILAVEIMRRHGWDHERTRKSVLFRHSGLVGPERRLIRPVRINRYGRVVYGGIPWGLVVNRLVRWRAFLEESRDRRRQKAYREIRRAEEDLKAIRQSIKAAQAAIKGRSK